MPKRNFNFGNKQTGERDNRGQSNDLVWNEDPDPVYIEWSESGKVFKISRDTWSSKGKEGISIGVQAGYWSDKSGVMKWVPSFKNGSPVPQFRMPVAPDEDILKELFGAIWSKHFPDDEEE